MIAFFYVSMMNKHCIEYLNVIVLMQIYALKIIFHCASLKYSNERLLEN